MYSSKASPQAALFHRRILIRIAIVQYRSSLIEVQSCTSELTVVLPSPLVKSLPALWQYCARTGESAGSRSARLTRGRLRRCHSTDFELGATRHFEVVLDLR